jgi:hypothetical protein
MSAYSVTPGGKTPMMEVSRVFSEGGNRLSPYDLMTLETMLRRVGFVDIRKEAFRCGCDAALVIDSEDRACESLYVEASAPPIVQENN